MKTARRIAALEAVTAISGLVTMALAVATGNWPVAMIATAVMVAATAGPVLLAGAVALFSEWKEGHVEADEACRLRQMEATIEQAGGRPPGIKESMADLRAYYAVLDGGNGRFRERLAAEPEPGRDRAP
jgi:hypothetical protein